MSKHRLNPFEEPPKTNLRVHELAKELATTSRGLLSYFASEGISVRSASSLLDKNAESLVRSAAAVPGTISDEAAPGISRGADRPGRHARPSGPA